MCVVGFDPSVNFATFFGFGLSLTLYSLVLPIPLQDETLITCNNLFYSLLSHLLRNRNKRSPPPYLLASRVGGRRRPVQIDGEIERRDGRDGEPLPPRVTDGTRRSVTLMMVHTALLALPSIRC